jgi:S-adenosylmethionine synthetase
LSIDPNAKVACESAVKNSLCMVFGEISVNGDVSFEQIARHAIKEVGYDSVDVGMDYKTAVVIVAIDKQSPDIAQGVHLNKNDEEIGAGDQGLMIGYASD